jgi:small subunit ribosomal protein S25e
MSWYRDINGQQVWINRDERIYSIAGPTDLVEETMAYLSSTTKKAVYQEQVINEDLDMAKIPKKQREKLQGKQRGFIVRVDTEQHVASRVVPFFRVAATKLLESVASRVDCDEAVNLKKKKILTNGANECRFRTTARVKHMTYGRGFRVEVVEGVVHQNVFFFTKQELSPVQWHQHVVDALEASGGHVLLAAASETGEKDVGGEVSNGTKGVLPKTKAQQEDDDWVHTLMTGCLVGDACLEKTVEAVTPVQAEERPVSREAPRTETPVGAKGKVKDKAQNAVYLDKVLYERVIKEVPTFKMITPSVLIDRLKINGSVARLAIRHFEREGQIKPVIHHNGQLVYTRNSD